MEEGAGGESVDFSGQQPLGSCPKCGGHVFEHGKFFVCKRSVAVAEGLQAVCDFRVFQTLMSQTISFEQLTKLLNTGKTDLLKGFISLRTGKRFRARLVWDASVGKIDFEYPDPIAASSSKEVKVTETYAAVKPKSPDVGRSIAKAFHSKHQRASTEFLDELFGLDKADKSIESLVNALQTLEQTVFSKFLERGDCPDWLGIWIAKHGRKEQQFAYLFCPATGEEVAISERIAARPPEIKRLFWNSRAPVVVGTLMAFDDETYLTWAREIGFDLEIKVSNLEPKGDEEYVPNTRGQINDWSERVLDPVIDALWKEHVPEKGECTVLQGEMARCIGRLEGEYWRNGMSNMGDGFYDRMVDKIRDTVLDMDSFSPLVKKVVAVDAAVVKGANYSELVNQSLFQESSVETSLGRLKNVAAAWCLKNPEPIPYSP